MEKTNQLLYDLKIEQSLLACFLRDTDDVAVFADKVPDEVFSSTHRPIWRRMKALSGKDIDAMSIAAGLPNVEIDGQDVSDFLDRVLVENVGNRSIDSYVEALLEKYHYRTIRTNVVRLFAATEHKSLPLDEVRDMAMELGELAADSTAQIVDKSPMEHWLDRSEQIARYHLEGHRPEPGLPTGIEAIDRIWGGMRKGSLIVVGANTSVGKSNLSLSIANNLIKRGKRVLYVSLENTVKEIQTRYIAMNTTLTWNRIDYHIEVTDAEYASMIDALGVAAENQFGILDSTTIDKTYESIYGAARRHKAKYGLDLLIVDYLGEIIVPGVNNDYSRATIAAKQMKMLAQKLDVPLICPSQVSGRDEQSEPTIDKLRDSGAIGEAADIVAMLHRDKNDVTKTGAPATLNTAKNRTGGTTGVANILFIPQKASFTDGQFETIHL